MKIFLTGATGYIGHSLANNLAEQGHTVHALVRNPGRAHLHSTIRIFVGDIADKDAIARAMSGCEQVFHLAAFAKLWARRKNIFYEVNVSGTRNVLTVALEKGITKLVYTSTCGVFGNSVKLPLSEEDPRVSSFENDYDLSKHICENMTREFVHKGLPCVIVNPSRVYGPGVATFSNPISKMIERCLQHRIVIVPGPGNVIANYAYIDDVVRGHIGAMNFGISGERYILGGENLSYDEVLKIVNDQIRKTRVIPLPPAVLKGIGHWNLIKNRMTGIEPVLTPDIVNRITKNAALDCAKAINQLEYKITPFTVGIRKTIESSKKNIYD